MTEELKQYFNGDELASSVWKGKYAIKGESSPRDMHIRMAKEFARIEAKYLEMGIDNFDHISEFGQELIDRLSEKEIGEKELTDWVLQYFDHFKYIVPQGSIMSMLGNKYKIGSLSNCFVIGQPYDSYGGIFQKDQQLVQLMKRRGGVGIDISTLRPNTALVSNAAGSSTGAISFMHRYSNSTREVAQNGRRGALMITIDCRHPDLLDFINIKKDLTQVTGANISVRLRDDFMIAVRNNEDYFLRFPCDFDNQEFMDGLTRENGVGFDEKEYPKEYDKLVTYTDNTLTGDTVYIRRIKARDYFLKLVENNWLSAEPGSMFVDRHWNYSPDGVYPQYRGITTNPCGEIFMQMYDACRLLALNLFSFVKHPFTDKAELDYKKLYEVAYVQQRLADDLVDLELEHIQRIIDKITTDPEPIEIKQVELDLWRNIYKTAKAGRRTGCGFTGLGDMLAALGLKYDSNEAKEIINLVMKSKLQAELDCTIDLAIERGTFEGWDVNREFTVKTIDTKSDELVSGKNDFYEMLRIEFPELALKMSIFGRRNVSWSTVAPTGSVSLLTQTTSGLEPLFAAFYFRNKKGNPGDKDFRVDFVDQNGDSWMTYPVLHPKFKEWYQSVSNEDINSFKYGVKEQSLESMNKDMIEYVFKQSPWYGSCANDIDWIQRVEIQGIIQKYTTHSISSTINLPGSVSQDKVYEIYMRAWEEGLKGVTVYRDGCRTGVLTTDKKESVKFDYHDAPKRPKDLPCEIFTTVSKGKKWNIVVGLFDDKPYEVFAVPHFTDEDSMILRRVSRGRYDLILGEDTYHKDITSDMTDEESAITRLISTALRHGSSIDFIVEQLNKSHGSVVSFNRAIGRVLSKYAKKINIGKIKCSECGSTDVILEEGCQKCRSCGHSKCG